MPICADWALRAMGCCQHMTTAFTYECMLICADWALCAMGCFQHFTTASIHECMPICAHWALRATGCCQPLTTAFTYECMPIRANWALRAMAEDRPASGRALLQQIRTHAAHHRSFAAPCRDEDVRTGGGGAVEQKRRAKNPLANALDSWAPGWVLWYHADGLVRLLVVAAEGVLHPEARSGGLMRSHEIS